MKSKRRKLNSSITPHTGEVRARGVRMPSVGQGLLLVRTPAGGKITLGTRPADAANIVIPKAGKALNRPGIDKKKVIFREGSAGSVFAYSILSSDPSKVVRESADGTKRIGRLVNGRFQVR